MIWLNFILKPSIPIPYIKREFCARCPCQTEAELYT